MKFSVRKQPSYSTRFKTKLNIIIILFIAYTNKIIIAFKFVLNCKFPKTCINFIFIFQDFVSYILLKMRKTFLVWLKDKFIKVRL